MRSDIASLSAKGGSSESVLRKKERNVGFELL